MVDRIPASGAGALYLLSAEYWIAAWLGKQDRRGTRLRDI